MTIEELTIKNILKMAGKSLTVDEIFKELMTLSNLRSTGNDRQSISNVILGMERQALVFKFTDVVNKEETFIWIGGE